MRKIIASASLAALGTVSMQAASAPGLSPLEQSKPWSVGLAVRGFYDDNYTTSPKSVRDDSFGISVNPWLNLHKKFDQTLITLSYSYEMRWYEARPENEADHIQIVNFGLNHNFSENYRLQVTDRFYYGQESVVDLGPQVDPIRTNADYWRNTARAAFEADFAEHFGMLFAYRNQIWDYDQKGDASRSALLDRREHLATVEGLYHFRPETSGLLGYQFEQINYTDGEFIGFDADGNPLESDYRDSRSHRIYVGVQHKPSSNIDLGLRVGGQFTDYIEANDDVWIPFVDARGTYTYSPGSFFQIGVVHTLNATDVLAMSQESTSIWGLVNHRITPNLTGSVLGQFQYSSFEDGNLTIDASRDLFYLLGVNLLYKFNQYLGAEAGYNWDRLDSDISGRSYSRNRVYLGLRATY